MSGTGTWVRRNRLTLAWAVFILALGAILYGPTDTASSAFFLLFLAGIMLAALLDHRRLARDIRSGRDRLWPRT